MKDKVFHFITVLGKKAHSQQELTFNAFEIFPPERIARYTEIFYCYMQVKFYYKI